jgi:hypothetical protein
VNIEIRKQTRSTLGEHGLADARRTVKPHVVSPGRSYLTGRFGLHVTDHIG